MSNDIRDILEKLTLLESNLTPASVEHGLNKQQKSVPQMPALFKPKTQKILGGNPSAKNPMSGYAVGGCEESVEVDKEELEEAQANEEKLLDKVKKSFADYLSSIEDTVKADSDLKDKINGDTDLKNKDKKDKDLMSKSTEMENIDQLPATQPQGEPGVSVKECWPVKTVTLENGRVCEIHGDEHSGFEVRHGNRSLKSRFKKIDHALMAIDMYMNKLRQQDESADYVEER